MTAINKESTEYVTYRDAHKDAYGFRSNPTATTQEELVEDYNRLCDVIVESIDFEKRQQDACWVKFLEILNKLESNVGTQAKALKYLLDAEGADHGTDGERYDLGYFCYCYGISYQKETTLKEILES